MRENQERHNQEDMDKYVTDVINYIGEVRDENEDNFLLNNMNRTEQQKNIHCNHVFRNENIVIAVFDGMGGEKNGNLASLYASESLKDLYQKNSLFNLSSQQIIEKLNSTICELSSDLKCKCGTTVAFIKVRNDIAQICNVGDSRIYLFRNHQLRQLTEDHTERATVLKLQERLGIQIDNHQVFNNTLTQFLGIEKNEFALEPFIYENLLLENDDLFLICTDGLSHYVEDEKIAEILNTDESLKNMNEKLYGAALENGCTDNITTILLKVEKNKIHKRE